LLIISLRLFYVKKISASSERRGKHEANTNHPTTLFFDPSIPSLIRYGLPFMLVLDDAMLLYSNFTLGAAVNVSINVREQAINQPLYNVTLHNSIVDMWNAKCYYLSALIAGE